MKFQLVPNLFFLLLLTLISNTLLSQSNFKPGYLITNQNDTLFGFVDSRSNSSNSRICRFRTDPDSKTMEYKPYEIKAYRFTEEGRFYVSYSVMSNGVAKEIFAEYLLDGVVDLYFYQDSEPHFLLQNTTGDVYELKSGLNKSASIEGKTPGLKSNNYIGLLKACFNEQPSLFKDIDILKLSQASLVDISVRYHDLSCVDEKCIVYYKPQPPVSVEANIFFGPDFRIPSLGGTEGPITLGDYKYRSGFRVGILSSITSPLVNDRFYLQLGYYIFQSHLAARNYVANGKSQVFSDMALKGSSLGINIVYRYPRGKLRPYASTGISFSTIDVATDFEYRILDYDIVEDWSYTQKFNWGFGFNGSLGCSYMGFKSLYLNLSANYDNTSSISGLPNKPHSNGPFYLRGFSTLFSVGYRFNNSRS